VAVRPITVAVNRNKKKTLDINGQIYAFAALIRGKLLSVTQWLENCWGKRACMDVVGNENFLPMPGIEVGPSTHSSLNFSVDTHLSSTEIRNLTFLVIMAYRILSKPRILVAVAVLLTTLEYFTFC
jgi:hypothetical protein